MSRSTGLSAEYAAALNANCSAQPRPRDHCARRYRQSRLPYFEHWANIETVMQNGSCSSGVVVASEERSLGTHGRSRGSTQSPFGHWHTVQCHG
jgi:hypothetical protein